MALASTVLFTQREANMRLVYPVLVKAITCRLTGFQMAVKRLRMTNPNVFLP